jgi:hypothetical protein
MRIYLVESYAASGAVEEQHERAIRTAELGTGVRYVRTTFLPAEETVLHVFEATSPEALREAARDAALSFERIVEAVEDVFAARPKRRSGDEFGLRTERSQE